MRRENKLSEEKWQEIRIDYLTSDISLRGLEKKYGVSFSAIRNRCEKEKWVDQKKEVSTQTAQKSIDLVSTHKANECAKAFMVANKLLAKIEKAVDAVEDADTGAIKQLTSAIKDLKEIGVFRADLDKQEQMARIKKLQKESEEEQKDTTITVVFDDGMDEYAD